MFTKPETFRARFDKLHEIVASCREKHREANRATAPAFNIFHLLGVAQDEVKTHSAVIADLLNPNGSHGQGDAFLKSFLTRLGRGEDADSAPVRDWVVTTEESISQGRLDIVVRSWAKPLLLVIENKIRRGERQNQLHDYWVWMQGQDHYSSNTILVFLTPDGREPQSARNAPVRSMSYETVAAWLDSVYPQIKAEPVRQAIEQYRCICSQLWRNSMEETDVQESEILEMLSQPDKFAFAQEVVGLFPKVIRKFRIDLKSKIEKEPALSGVEVEFVDGGKPTDQIDIFTSRGGGKLALRIRIEEDHDGLYCGILRPDGPKHPYATETVADIPGLHSVRADWETEHAWWIARHRIGTGSVRDSKIPLRDLENNVMNTVIFLLEKSRDFLDRKNALLEPAETQGQ